jgi:hypothetical protein
MMVAVFYFCTGHEKKDMKVKQEQEGDQRKLADVLPS